MAAPPSNGILACAETSTFRLCMPSCDSKFDLASVPEHVYSCANGNWLSFPNFLKGMSWPDCSGKALIVICYYYDVISLPY